METWSGRLLDGTPVRLGDVNSQILILNFYSPTCQPCIEELPALEILYETAKKKNASMYIVLEGNPLSHGLEERGNEEENYIEIRNRMQEDVMKYAISIPVLIIDARFPVFGEGGLITGTPETILLKTQPLVLKYNFVGPIASTGTLEEIKKDERLSFILARLNEL